MIVLVFEEKDREDLERHLDDRGFNYYEMKDYFKMEGFTTLAEVQRWCEEDFDPRGCE